MAKIKHSTVVEFSVEQQKSLISGWLAEYRGYPPLYTTVLKIEVARDGRLLAVVEWEDENAPDL